MTLRASFLLLSLLSTCGCTPISDESAMLQVVTDFTSAEGGSLELDSEEGDPEAAMIRKNVETAFDIYKKKTVGDTTVLSNISKQLAQAWVNEVNSQVQSGIKQLLGMQEKMFKKVTGNGTAFNGTKALEAVGKYLNGGGLTADVFKWVSKMADAQGAMAHQLIDKSIDWQKLAAGNFMLNSQKTTVSDDPELAIMRRNVEQAFDIYKKKTAGDIAVMSDIYKTLSKAWEDEFRRNLNKARAMTIGKTEEKLMAQKNATNKNNNDVVAAVDHWMKENIKEGKLAWKILPKITKMGEQAAMAAQQWLDKSIDWQKLAAGAFMQMGQKTKVGQQPEFDLATVADALANVKSQLKRRAEQMADEQKKMLIADKVPEELHQWMTANVKHGTLDENTVKGIKTFMENSAALAQKWQANSIDLQKLISGYFMVDSQHPRIVIDDNTKKTFEQVMLFQERLVKQASTGLEQAGILKDGKLTPAAAARVKAIFDETAEKAKQWLAKNVEYQKLAGEALAHLAKK